MKQLPPGFSASIGCGETRIATVDFSGFVCAFVGSLFSTFSAIIQRTRGFAGCDESFKYVNYPVGAGTPPFRSCEFHNAGDGIFSWNRLQYPLSPETHSWFREWPEAFRLQNNKLKYCKICVENSCYGFQDERNINYKRRDISNAVIFRDFWLGD